MNILFLCRLYYPHVGGVEKHVEKICDILSRKHKLRIITYKFDDNLKDYEVINGIEVYRMKAATKLGVWNWMANNKYILDWAEVLHVHDVYFWIIPYKLLNPKKKTFITFHGYEGNNAPKINQIFWHKFAEWLSDGNICIGDFHKKWYFTKPDVVSYGAV